MSPKDYGMTIDFNPFIFKALLKYLQPKNQEKILDIGCSRGFYVKGLERVAGEVIGIDNSKKSLAEAVTTRVQYGDATNLDFQDNTFDKIYSLHTIEHITDLESLFHETARVMRPGGVAVFVYPWEIVKGILALWAACRQYKNPLMCRRIHVHRLTPGKIKKLIKNTSLIHRKSKLIFALWFHFVTILQKPK